MSQYSLIEEVAIKQLSSKALIHLSRLSRLIKKTTGHSLNLQDPLLMKKLTQHIRLSADPIAHKLFGKLVNEITQKAQGKRQFITAKTLEKSAAQQMPINRNIQNYQRV